MEPILWEWVNFILRWLHVITAIAWIGSSFYFIHLDASLRRRDGLPSGTAGDAWQVHGGGFYHMMKYTVAPAQLPQELTWFKWEAYTTWISGFLLLAVLYYAGAELLLIDPAVMELTAWQAIAISVGTLALGWVVYDRLCKSRLGEDDGRLAATGFVLLVAAAWGFTEVFSGRGAFIQMGALIGTMMTANVFLIIIPNQRKVVKALLAGEAPDPRLGKRAKQRSLHNNYLTLPVIFLMISNHYPLAFATRWNWVIVGVVLLVGAVIRHFFNSRHAGRPTPWWTWGAAAAGMGVIVWLSTFVPERAEEFAEAEAAAEATAPVELVRFEQVEEIVLSRCSMCHAATPVWEGIVTPPRGVELDTAEAIRRHARLIGINAGLSDAMPPANITMMTPEERRILATWAAQSAGE